MAEFSKLFITGAGRELIARLITGEAEQVEFTKLCASEQQYDTDSLEALTELSGIRQTSLISGVERTNGTAVKITAAFTNTELETGYFLRTLGLYARDPAVGEILYAVTVETGTNCYMPPYNGVTVSGAYIELVSTVGNAENVSLEVDPLALVTFKQFRPVKEFAEAELTEEDIDALFEGSDLTGYIPGSGTASSSGISRAYIDEQDRLILEAAKLYAANYTDASQREEQRLESEDIITEREIDGLLV